MHPNREYFELEEISQFEGVTKNDLIDFFRRKKINLFLWCSEARLIGQVSYKGINKPFTCGQFTYSGVVKPDRSFIEDLIERKKEVQIEKFLVIELQEITNWKPTKPIHITYPNKRFENHKELDIPPSFPFYAFITAQDSEEKHKSFMQAFDLLQQNLSKYKEGDSSVDYFKGFKDSIKAQVSITPKRFKPIDIRFSKSEVLELIKPKSRDLKLKPRSSNNLKAPNPLNELIIKLVKNNPGRSDHIWNLLRIESKKELFDREYDDDSILEEVSLTELTWRNPRNNKQKSLLRSSFKNTLSDLKKKHNL